jgi:hypothetical protein
MIAGLPGTGIGGIFYVVSALGAPVRAWRARRRGGRRTPAAPVWGLVLMAVAVSGAVWVTGWALGLLLARPLGGVFAALGGARSAGPAPSLIRTVSLLFAFATLAAVLVAVEIARLVVRRRLGGSAPAGSIAPHAAPFFRRGDAA